jgi:hypothetical protein
MMRSGSVSRSRNLSLAVFWILQNKGHEELRRLVDSLMEFRLPWIATDQTVHEPSKFAVRIRRALLVVLVILAGHKILPVGLLGLERPLL